MKELPVRKKNRLKNYDYSQTGCYFITICTKDAHELLGEIDVSVGANCVRPRLSEYGSLVENEISSLSNRYDSIEITNHVVMPNHIHILLVIENRGRTQFAPTVSRIVKQFKGAITKQIGFSIWQKSFHDHIIRNKSEYCRIWHYIDQNPAKWMEDCYYIL